MNLAAVDMQNVVGWLVTSRGVLRIGKAATSTTPQMYDSGVFV